MFSEQLIDRKMMAFRYQELQKLLGVENIEKATLLTQAADYTRQLQVSWWLIPALGVHYNWPICSPGVLVQTLTSHTHVCT